jgi:hypothetical protein
MVAAAVAAMGPKEMAVMLKIQKRKQIMVRAKDNIGAFTPVSAIRLAFALVLIAVKAFTAPASAASPDNYFSAINEHFV